MMILLRSFHSTRYAYRVLKVIISTSIRSQRLFILIVTVTVEGPLIYVSYGIFVTGIIFNYYLGLLVGFECCLFGC
jgi:CHASE2 domain-containing sensor protein